MMQEHPFFSSGQIFFGQAIYEDKDVEEEEIIWGISLGEMQINHQSKIGLFFFWSEVLPTNEIHFS